MAIQVVRIEHEGAAAWGVVRGKVIEIIDTESETTNAFVERYRKRLRSGAVSGLRSLGTARLLDARILSPITRNQQIIAQAMNYRDHALEVGVDPATLTRNVFFRKASSSITGPFDPIIRPPNVRLLDYEVELGLVIGRDISKPVCVTRDTLHRQVAALVIVNDVSARDVQLPEGQFYKGKSYRTFAPCGPYLCFPEEDEFGLIDDLQVRADVNGEQRQLASTSGLVFKPAPTVQELSEVMDLFAGDVIATGTPGGVAIRAPKTRDGGRVNLAEFLTGELQSPRYLKPGDRVEMYIRSTDGRIDLGQQTNFVRDAAPATFPR